MRLLQSARRLPLAEQAVCPGTATSCERASAGEQLDCGSGSNAGPQLSQQLGSVADSSAILGLVPPLPPLPAAGYLMPPHPASRSQPAAQVEPDPASGAAIAGLQRCPQQSLLQTAAAASGRLQAAAVAAASAQTSPVVQPPAAARAIETVAEAASMQQYPAPAPVPPPPAAIYKSAAVPVQTVPPVQPPAVWLAQPVHSTLNITCRIRVPPPRHSRPASRHRQSMQHSSVAPHRQSEPALTQAGLPAVACPARDCWAHAVRDCAAATEGCRSCSSQPKRCPTRGAAACLDEAASARPTGKCPATIQMRFCNVAVRNAMW